MRVNGDHIRNWIDKSKTEPDYFDKFVYGFFAFNALYNDYYESDKTEISIIKSFFDDLYEQNKPDIKNDLIKIFDLPEYSYFCDREAIRNMRFNIITDGSQRNVERIRERIPKASSKAMLIILYQIRCNLFHGDKSFKSEHDQEIMKNASELMLQYNMIFSKYYRPSEIH